MSNINLLKIFEFEVFKFIILLRTYRLDRYQTALSKMFFIGYSAVSLVYFLIQSVVKWYVNLCWGIEQVL